MTDRSIFMTYNPGVNLEQTLAIRLHTIGQISGFEMYLPDRYNNLRNVVDPETAYRISAAKWFICFSTQRLSLKVRQEIEYAFQAKHDPSRVIVIYDASRSGKNLKGLEHGTEYYFDPTKETADQAIVRIIDHIDRINQAEASMRNLRSRLKKLEEEKRAMSAFLGIGISLIVLSVFSDDEQEKPVAKKSSARKSSTRKAPAKKSPRNVGK